jgi:hypothetical protein
MKKNTFFVGTLAMLLVFGFLLTGCASLFFKQKAITIKTKSRGESGIVRIYERSKIAALTDDKGAIVYNGELPARVPITIRGGQFIVEYTDSEGNPATKVIGAALNPWVILDAASLFGLVVDLVTGNMFSYHFSDKRIPISYQAWDEFHTEAWIVEGIPPQIAEEQLVLIGHLNDE